MRIRTLIQSISRDATNIRPYFISGIWPVTGFDLPDPARYWILKIAGYPAKWKFNYKTIALNKIFL
jgi:hypothetical protein